MQVVCPHCRAKGNLEDRYLGRKVRCSACRKSFIVRPPAERPLKWYLAEGKEKKGPFSTGEMQAKAAAGELDGATLVWHRRLPKWLPAAMLFPALAGPETEEAVCASCYKVERREGMMAHGDGLVCEACKLALLRSKHEQGENQSNDMEAAGMWGRIVAKVLDIVIMTVIAVAVEKLARHFFVFHAADGGPGAAFIAILLVNMFIGMAYMTGFVGRFGATPGKMIMGMRVVDSDGGRIGYWRAFLRYVGEFVVVPVTVFVGYLVALFDADRRTLYDRIAGTLVVKA